MSVWLRYGEAHPGRDASVSGDVRVFRGLESDGLDRRDILVYLPSSLAKGTGGSRVYPVLYMHDGQNLFDAEGTFAGEWGVDEAAEAAAAAGSGEVVVVGIPNAGERRAYEYSPWRSEELGWGGGGDAYLEFLSRRVRPLVEASWPVRKDPAGVGIAGSSLGGLISLYAALARPREYGSCGAFSPALIVAEAEIRRLADEAAGPRLAAYMDVGRGESLLGEGRDQDGATPYVAAVRRMRDLLLKRGGEMRYVEDDLDHNEAAWRSRFPVFLDWFLAHAGAQAVPNTTR